MEPIKPHDLLYVNYTDLILEEKLPDWVNQNRLTDWAVVRRDQMNDDLIPVGLREKNRNERFACWVKQADIIKVVTPYDLIAENYLQQVSEKRQREFEIFKTFKLLGNYLSNYKWGVGGSLGYELASQRPAIKQTSDIDVLIESNHPLTPSQKQELLSICKNMSNRMDIQIITPFGGCSLLELCQNNTHVLLKTISGPMLVENPWIEPKKTIESIF